MDKTFDVIFDFFFSFYSRTDHIAFSIQTHEQLLNKIHFDFATTKQKKTIKRSRTNEENFCLKCVFQDSCAK